MATQPRPQRQRPRIRRTTRADISLQLLVVNILMAVIAGAVIGSAVGLVWGLIDDEVVATMGKGLLLGGGLGALLGIVLAFMGPDERSDEPLKVPLDDEDQ